MIRSKRWTAIALQMFSAMAMAQEAPRKFAAPVEDAVVRDAGTGADALQIFGSLAIVVATILVIGWVARRLRAAPRGRAGRLKVVDEVAIGPKERAVLLEFDGMHLVLGVGEGRVNILHRTAALAERDAESAEASAPGVGTSSFMDVLKRTLGK